MLDLGVFHGNEKSSMALIKCPECGKEISDKAEACPNCGCPINNNSSPVNSLINSQDVPKQENAIEKTKITIWGFSCPPYWKLMAHMYISVNGNRIAEFPLGGSYELYIDRDSEILVEFFGLKNASSRASYTVKYGREESLVLKYSKTFGAISIEGLDGASKDSAKENTGKIAIGCAAAVILLPLFLLLSMCS